MLRLNPFLNGSNNDKADSKAADESQDMLLLEDDIDVVPDLAKTSMFGG